MGARGCVHVCVCDRGETRVPRWRTALPWSLPCASCDPFLIRFARLSCWPEKIFSFMFMSPASAEQDLIAAGMEWALSGIGKQRKRLACASTDSFFLLWGTFILALVLSLLIFRIKFEKSERGKSLPRRTKKMRTRICSQTISQIKCIIPEKRTKK